MHFRGKLIRDSDLEHREKEVGHIEESLDRAIAKIAAAEFTRLKGGSSPQEVAGNIHAALEELGKLSGETEMPDYSREWVALLYTTWYQPRQVNLAYTLIRYVMSQQEGRLTRNTDGNLYMVDFGCGALATQISLTLAVAHALKKGQDLNSVEVYGLDSSQPMIDIGERLWEEWGDQITDADLRTAYSLVSSENAAPPRDAAGWTSNRIPADGDRWLVALHVSYPENATEVKGCLGQIDGQLKPGVGFVTSNNDRAVRRVWPFGSARLQYPLGLPRLSGECGKTTIWRRRILLDTYRPYLLDPKDQRYLSRPVKYNQSWDNLRCLLHLV